MNKKYEILDITYEIFQQENFGPEHAQTRFPQLSR